MKRLMLSGDKVKGSDRLLEFNAPLLFDCLCKIKQLTLLGLNISDDMVLDMDCRGRKAGCDVYIND